jgi:hypothetical protein
MIKQWKDKVFSSYSSGIFWTNLILVCIHRPLCFIKWQHQVASPLKYSVLQLWANFGACLCVICVVIAVLFWWRPSVHFCMLDSSSGHFTLFPWWPLFPLTSLNIFLGMSYPCNFFCWWRTKLSLRLSYSHAL